MLFIACETVSVCFSVTVTEAARFMSVNRAVAFCQSKYCNFTGVILWLVGALYSPYSNFSTQSPPQIAFNQYTNRKNESRCLYLHSDWVGKTDVWVGLAHPCPCLEPALVNRKKHEVLQNFLVNGCGDFGFHMSVCGGSWCLDPSLSPFPKILESILLDNPHKAAVLSVGFASFSSTLFPSTQISVNMLGYSILWTASFFAN